jgi:hypothetical protein
MGERRSKDPYRIYYVEAVHETDAAALYDFGTGEDIWIPKSQILDEGDYDSGEDEQWIEIPEWLAYEKGLL